VISQDNFFQAKSGGHKSESNDGFVISIFESDSESESGPNFISILLLKAP